MRRFPSPRVTTAAIVLLALVLRIVYFLQVRRSPFFEHPLFDARDYASWAREIAEGNLLWDEFRIYPPGYPYFLGALSWLTGHDWFWMTFANALLGCGWILLLVLSIRRLLPWPTAEIAGLLAATYWPFFHFEAHLVSETWFIFLLLAAFWLLTRLDPPPRPSHRPWILAAAGFALGIATITRPNAIASLPFIVWLLAAKDEGPLRARIVRTWPLVAAVAAVTLPVMARNREIGGLFAIRHHVAINFYLGNRPDAAGWHTIRPGRDWDRLTYEPEREGGVRDLAGHERWFRGKVFAFARDDPAGFAALQLRKLGLFWDERELREIMSPYFLDRWAPLQAAPWLPDFGWIGPLAIVGLALGLLERPRPWLLYAFAVPQALVVVLTVVGGRYRLPVVPFLIAFAALAALRITGWIRARKWLSSAAALAGVAVGAVIAYRDVPEPGGFAEELARVAFVEEERGDFEAAARFWVESFQEDPTRIESYAGYSALALRAGDAPRALEATARGLALSPADADLFALRGRAFLRVARPDSAESALAAALAARPDDADALADLGRALFDLGRAEDGLEAFRRSIRLRPDDPGVLLDAAHVLVATRDARPEENRVAAARGLIERVLELDPANEEARARLAALPAPSAR